MSSIKAIYFEVAGILNSFRIPDFQTYHKTLLYPPKTTVCGMLGSVLGYSPQEVNDKLIPQIKIGIIIKDIGGRANDLWKIKKITRYSKGDEKMEGCVVIDKFSYYGAVIMRELLFRPQYRFYVSSDDSELLLQIRDKLVNPEWALSLGREDELILVHTISSLIDISEQENLYFTNTVLSCDISGNYDLDIASLSGSTQRQLLPPVINKLPTGFVYDGEERTARELQAFTVVMNIKIKLKDGSRGYRDGEYTFQMF